MGQQSHHHRSYRGNVEIPAAPWKDTGPVGWHGHSASFYTQRRAWGLLTGWGHQKLVPYVLGLQSQASTNMAKLLLENRHLRLDPEIQSWKLDDIKHVNSMKALADRDFTHYSKAILANLERIQ